MARNGTEALEHIEQNKPDLVLLDIMMPDVDGYQICAQIKSAPRLAHIKIVFLSAKTKEEDIQKGLDMGAELYITKPFSTKDLVKKIEQIRISAS